MAYCVVAYWKIRPGEEEPVHAALAKLVQGTRAEPGNLQYEPHVSVDDPLTIMIYERYVDEAAFDAHFASEHFKQHALAEAVPLLDERSRTFYTSLD